MFQNRVTVVNITGVNVEHLYKLFMMPEDKNSKLAQIEQHLSHNLLGFLSQHVATKVNSLTQIEKNFAAFSVPESPELVSKHAEALLETVSC
jgi:glutamate decarboxylase